MGKKTYFLKSLYGFNAAVHILRVYVNRLLCTVLELRCIILEENTTVQGSISLTQKSAVKLIVTPLEWKPDKVEWK
jgi:hypothetical protein